MSQRRDVPPLNSGDLLDALTAFERIIAPQASLDKETWDGDVATVESVLQRVFDDLVNGQRLR